MPRIRKNYRFTDQTIGFLAWLTGITGKDETAIVEEAIRLLMLQECTDLPEDQRRGLAQAQQEEQGNELSI